MRPIRHSSIADALSSNNAEQSKAILRDLAREFAPRRACDETNVWRLARRMRDEWRQRRYSRLAAK